MDKIAVNAFIHGGALSDPIELNPNFENDVLAYLLLILPGSPRSYVLHTHHLQMHGTENV